MAGGDLNSRTKDDLDYIPTVDGNTKLHFNRKEITMVNILCKDNRALMCKGSHPLKKVFYEKFSQTGGGGRGGFGKRFFLSSSLSQRGLTKPVPKMMHQ